MSFNIINKTSPNGVPMWGNQKKYIAVHYLGVDGQGHDLMPDGCGAHFYVYWDGTIYQRCSLDAVPWAVGTAGYYTQKHPIARNSNTISIEMCCHNSVGSKSADDGHWWFTKETQEATAWLVAKLMKDLGIPEENVLRHYDIVNKVCPNPYVLNNRYNGSWTWEEFLQNVRVSIGGSLPFKKGEKLKLLEGIPLRTNVSENGQKGGYARYSTLPAPAKKRCRRLSNDRARVKAGTVVTVRDVRFGSGGNVWIRIKSGWLPVIVGGKKRVKEAE